MQKRQQAAFTTVHSEGTLFTGDMLQRIAKRETKLEGLTLEDYHLLKSDQFNEAITRAWEEALKAWSEYTRDCQAHPERHLALTREWVLRLLSPLNYGRVQRVDAIQAPQRTYAISHNWQHIPIHLVSSETELDKVVRSSNDARRSSPYSLVQELLNRVDGYRWGIVSNGNLLRLLRKNVSMTRQAYIEFDLEAMMKGEVYADFVLFWLLCHQSRFEGEKPEDCLLEKWLRLSHDSGIRALDKLRDGVKQAIEILGTGFLRHPANRALHDKLRDGLLDTQDYYRQVLRLVYRFIIIFVAEDRQVLFHPQADELARARYKDYYSTARLRRLAERRTGTLHNDLYQSLALVIRLLGSDEGYQKLGLFAFNGFLFSDAAMPDLAHCQLANQDLLEAIRALAFMRENNVQLPVDYQHLGSEELGSVYESLLELVPVVTIGKDATVGEGTFELKTVSGNERKTTGSYYTPTSLIDCLLDSALEPVLEEACKKADREKAILDLKVCDPACGSGHFLVAAAYRIAKRLASIRSGDLEPPAEVWREALREVVGHCIYGVDINPMSVELCKVRLWMEAIEPGKPFSFLDSHILEGNSLLGSTPALLARGIPDSAFEPIGDDDKKICNEYKRLNKKLREGNRTLFDPEGRPWDHRGNLAASMMQLDDISDATVQGYHRKQEFYRQVVESTDYLSGRLLADTWCAAFVWKKTKEFSYPITDEIFWKIEKNPHDIVPWMRDEIVRLRKQYKFFHWHLEFPGVFRTPANGEEPENEQAGWCGGFDVVLSNPPWEHTELKEQEWFANRNPEIANAVGAERKNKIEALKRENPQLYSDFLEARRQEDSWSHFVRNSERYPLCGRGRINTYAIFAETNRILLRSTGRVGCIVQTGIATDDNTKHFFKTLVRDRTLVSLHSFENEEFVFPAVHHATKFCLLTIAGLERVQNAADFVFFARQTVDLKDTGKHFSLSTEEIDLLNPNTGTCPTFRSRRDAEMAKGIYRRVSVMIREKPREENPWGITFRQGVFNMTSDSHLFSTRKQLEDDGWRLQGNLFFKDNDVCLPLYEGKMISHFDHRFGTYQGQTVSQANQNKLPELTEQEHSNPLLLPIPQFWIHKSHLPNLMYDGRKAFLGFRDSARSVDSRTAFFCIFPAVPCGNTLPLILLDSKKSQDMAYLAAATSSFVFDYCARQKVGGIHLNYFFVKQLPVLTPRQYSDTCVWDRGTLLGNWVLNRALELIYTAWDLEPFAKDCGYDGSPFIWDEERRFLLRCELDAVYFHLYGIERDDVDYIMETFPIVKRKDEKQYGDYRTKRVILEMYDEMKRAIETGEPYQTWVSPPPADPGVAHPPREGVQI